MKKKFPITFLVIALVFMFILPSTLFADTYDFSVTVEKQATGFDSGVFEFEMYFIIFDPPDYSGWIGGSIGTIGHTGGSIPDINLGEMPDDWGVFMVITESGTNGATGVEVSLDSFPTATDGFINSTVSFSLSYDDHIKTVYFDNIKVARPEPEPEPKPEPEPESIWVRTMPMTCWQVFINEDKYV